MKKPDFLIIGAQKAGTTWLYRNLRVHREVFLPTETELQFFNKPDCESPSRLDRYFEHFEAADESKRVGEKTPGYFWSTDRTRSLTQPPPKHNPDIPGAVARVLGENVDLIVSLRHPVDRAISAFGHHLKRGRILPDARIRDVADRFGILDIGHYAAHSRAWLGVFPRERFHVIVFETDVVARPLRGYRGVCQFLGIDADFRPPNIQLPRNKGLERKQDLSGLALSQGEGRVVIDREDIEYLVSKYEGEVDELEHIWGLDLGIWKLRTKQLLDEVKPSLP